MSFRQAKRKRNIFTLIAIILTTVLFTVLFSTFIRILDSFEMETIKQTTNSAHAAIMYIDDEKYNVIKEHHNMYKELGYEKIISEGITCEDKEMSDCALVNMNESAAEMTFCTPTQGRMPEDSSEIALDRRLLSKLGKNIQIGDIVNIKYCINGIEQESEFTLCGTWESTSLNEVYFALVSDSFCELVEKNYNVLQNKGDDSFVVHAYIKFDSNKKIEKKLEKLVEACGMESEQYNVNWAYLSNSVHWDYKLVLSIGCCLGAIMLTGYLLINNIYQITLANDIRYYGLLKIVGVTSGQMGKMLICECLIVGTIGIALGETIGYLISLKICPLIMAMTNVEVISGEPNISLFLFAALFSFATLLISIMKPYIKLRKISPVDAVRYW